MYAQEMFTAEIIMQHMKLNSVWKKQEAETVALC